MLKMNGRPMTTRSCLLSLVMVSALLSACATNAPPKPPDQIDPAKLEKWLVQQWQRGSGYSDDEASLRSASRAAGTTVVGKLVRRRSITHAPFYRYPLVGYLIKIEKIGGLADAPVRDAAGNKLGSRALQAGDEIWLFARIFTPDTDSIPREYLIADGDSIWAAFERPPEMARAVTDEGALPIRWTSGLLADKLGTGMQ